MIDLSTITPETLHARGCYSTVRSAHEDSKKELVKFCEDAMKFPTAILKHGQSTEVADIDKAIKECGDLAFVADVIRRHLENMRSLAEQRAALKKEAWK